MFNKLKSLFNNIKKLSSDIDNYQKDSIILSMPSIAYVNKAKKLLDKKEYDAAEKLLLKALEISSNDATVYKYLGKVNEYTYRFKDAVTYYEKSAQINDSDREIWLRLGMTLLYSDSPDKAISAFEKADKITPMNTDVYTGHGMALMKLKKYALARDKFNKAAQISKYNYTAIMLSAVMESRLGEYAKAEEKLAFLTKVAPTESCYYEYANLKFNQEKYDDAEFYALKSLELNRKMLPSYFILGRVYSINNNKEQTENLFNSALEQDLENSTLYYEWGCAYLNMLHFNLAYEKFQKSLELEPEYTDPKICIALLNSYNNDFTLLEELKQKNGSNAYIQQAIGLEYFYNGNYDNAIDMFNNSLKIAKNQSYNYLNLARTYTKINNNTKATEYYDKFTQTNPKYIYGFIEYAKFLINISNFEEAKRKLEKAQKLDDTNLEVLNLLFLCQYTIVKKNICEYNIKEAIFIAKRALDLGRFDYTPKLQELEGMLKEINVN